MKKILKSLKVNKLINKIKIIEIKKNRYFTKVKINSIIIFSKIYLLSFYFGF